MPGIEVLTLQFVDSIGSSPTVLLDLNTRAPLFVLKDGWNAPPPQKQVSAFRSSARDGATVAQESYDDREITIELGINSGSNDQAAETIQAISRLLDQPQWLKYQPGTTAPVFFRTRPGVIEGLEEYNGQSNGARSLTLTIPAEPFSYGLPVTGTATINNDPTAGTNPMSYVFPTIQGDVAAPLSIKSTPSPGVVWSSMIAASNVPVATQQAAPLVASTFTLTAAGGWSASTVSDSTAIGGSARRLTNANPIAASGTVRAVATLPFGDYRLLVRARSSVSGATIKANATGASATVGLTTSFTKTQPVTTNWSWIDMGVLRFPQSAPQASAVSVFGAGPTASVGTLMVCEVPGTGSAGTTFDLNYVMWIPVGRNDAVNTSLLKTSAYSPFGSPSVTTSPLAIDAEMQTSTVGTIGAAIAMAGGFPQVVPGLSCYLSFVRAVATDDDKTGTTSITWIYYPRYLYTRPATS